MRSKISVIILFLYMAFQISSEENPVLININTAGKAYEQGDYYTAIEYYKASLQINPVYTDALYGLAKTYFKLSEYDESFKYITAARQIDKYETVLMVLEARIHTALGSYTEAKKILKKVLEKEPNNTDAEIGMAELYVASGDILNAIKIYNETLLYLPNDRRSLLSLIIILDSRKEYSRADKYVSHLLRLYPNDSVVQYTAAKHFQYEGKPGQTEIHAAASVALDDRNQPAVLLLARIYISQMRYKEASRQLESVLKKNRKQPLVWYMLAEIYRLQNKYAKALRSYSIAVSIDSDDELLRIALESFIINNAAVDDPVREKYADYHFKKGEEFQGKNYLNKTREEYRRGLVIDPHSDKGWLLYAEWLKKEGYLSRYLSILKEVAKNEPDNRDLQDEIEIYDSILLDTVASRWEVDQFEIEKPRFTVGLFSKKSAAPPDRFNSDYYINRYVKNLLQGSERINVVCMEEDKEFAQAFSLARKNQCDYFIIMNSTEGENTFSIAAKMYHGKTGALLKNFSIFRTGINRVSSTLMKLNDQVQSLIPLQGTILKRKFSNALVDLGRVDGLKKDDVFLILKPSEGLSIDENFNYKIDKTKILGEILINSVDDLISEGTIKKYNFFDLITAGDILVLDSSHEKDARDNPAAAEEKSIPSDIYKTILTIP